MTAASIRTKNPGAMWPGPVSRRFGSVNFERLNDKQRNEIAIFPTYADGIAAQFYLWRTKYAGKTLAGAVYEWSGHNSPGAYASKLAAAVGISTTTLITNDFLDSPKGLRLMQVQADWECGGSYPASQSDWLQGQRMAMAAPVGVAVRVKPRHVAVAVGTAGAAAAAHASGAGQGSVLVLILVIAAIAGGVYIWRNILHKK